MEASVIILQIDVLKLLEPMDLPHGCVEGNDPNHQVIRPRAHFAGFDGLFNARFHLFDEKARAAAFISHDCDEGVLGGTEISQVSSTVSEVLTYQGVLY